MTIALVRIDPTNLRPTVQIVSFFVFHIGCVVLGTYVFFRGLRALRMKRYVRNVPRSKIRSAAIGPVELCGKAVGPYTVVPPGGEDGCLAYWRITEAQTVQFISAPLYLEDDTGLVMVSPRTLDMSLMPSLLEPGIYGAVRPGETIFVLGSLQMNPWAHDRNNADRDELSRIGPGFVSRAEAQVLTTVASPLFYPSEYDHRSDFDLFPPKILMKGKGPFIISQRSQREVFAELTWKIYCGVWGGPALAFFGLSRLIQFGAREWSSLLN